MMQMFWAPGRPLRRRPPCAAPRTRRSRWTPVGPSSGHGSELQHHHATERDAGSWRCPADRAAEIRLLERPPDCPVPSPPSCFRGSRASLASGVAAGSVARRELNKEIAYRACPCIFLVESCHWCDSVLGGIRTAASAGPAGVIRQAAKRGSSQRSTAPFQRARSFAYRPGSPIRWDQVPALFQECSQ
jgi:hypothetical protein